MRDRILWPRFLYPPPKPRTSLPWRAPGFGAPHQHRLLVGREPGRTIPLPDLSQCEAEFARDELGPQEWA